MILKGFYYTSSVFAIEILFKIRPKIILYDTDLQDSYVVKHPQNRSMNNWFKATSKVPKI